MEWYTRLREWLWCSKISANLGEAAKAMPRRALIISNAALENNEVKSIIYVLTLKNKNKIQNKWKTIKHSNLLNK